MPSGPTKDILLKQLTQKGLSNLTLNAITPVRNEDIYKWISATHDAGTQNRPSYAHMASINALVNAKPDKYNISTPPDCTCWDVDSLVTYVRIVPEFVQRPKILNAKRAITGHKTREAPRRS